MLGSEAPRGWARWRTGEAVADGVAWPVRFAPSLAERIRRLHERGLVECRWLTTWGDSANDGLRRLLDLPEFGVVPPSDSREWWKLAAVRALLAAEPQRRLVWTDDELCRHPEAVAWVRSRRAASLLLSPRPDVGLTPRQVREVEWFCQPRMR